MNAKSTLLAMLLAGSLALGAAPTLAQEAVNLAGIVESVDATSLAVKAEPDGAVTRFGLALNLVLLRSVPATLADIHPHDFVASAAVRGMDKKLHSTELRIFPEALRGAGEGQRPMNDARGQTMTNATVTGAVVANGSNTLAVTFAGGQSELVVDPDVPVTRIDVADRALLRAGAKVRVQGTRGPAGATAARITLQE